MREIAIEGLDGAGKTTIAHNLAQQYTQEGLHTLVASPYRLAQEKSGEELYPLWGTDEGAARAIDHIKNALAAIREEAHQEQADVLIYDRHWVTAFTEIASRPLEREL